MVAEGLRLDLLSGASRAEQNANVHRQMLDFWVPPRLGLWGRDSRFSLGLCGLTLIVKESTNLRIAWEHRVQRCETARTSVRVPTWPKFTSSFC